MAYLIKFTNQTITKLGEKEHDYKEGEVDLLNSLLAKHRKNPNDFTIADVHHHTLPNVVGGAETTGITLSAAVYYLWKNPQTLAKLRQKLNATRSAGNFHDIVTVKDAAGCWYLQAVIKETLRLHPGNCLGHAAPGTERWIKSFRPLFSGRSMSLLFSSAMIDDDQERLTDCAGGSEYKRLRSSRQLRCLRRRRIFVPPGTLASDQKSVNRMENHFLTVRPSTICFCSLSGPPPCFPFFPMKSYSSNIYYFSFIPLTLKSTNPTVGQRYPQLLGQEHQPDGNQQAHSRIGDALRFRVRGSRARVDVTQ